jgi:hypothetical protein
VEPIPQEQPLTFLERLRETFAQLADVIPAMLGALVILFAGYLLSKLIEQGRAPAASHSSQQAPSGGVMEAGARRRSFNPRGRRQDAVLI